VAQQLILLLIPNLSQVDSKGRTAIHEIGRSGLFSAWRSAYLWTQQATRMSEHVILVEKLVEDTPAPVAPETSGILRNLVEAGLDVDGNTPLHLAAVNNFTSGLVEALLALGANPSAQNDPGETPLHLALSFCTSEFQVESTFVQHIFLLDDVGSDFMAITINGDSLMHYAVATSNHHLVTYMLESDVPVDHCNNDGIAPLHLSIYLGALNIDITSILLKRSARLESSKLSSFGRSSLVRSVTRQLRIHPGTSRCWSRY